MSRRTPSPPIRRATENAPPGGNPQPTPASLREDANKAGGPAEVRVHPGDVKPVAGGTFAVGGGLVSLPDPATVAPPQVVRPPRSPKE